MTRQDFVNLAYYDMDEYAEIEYGIKNASKIPYKELLVLLGLEEII